MTPVLNPLTSVAAPTLVQMAVEAVTAECEFSQQLQNLIGSIEAASEGEAEPVVAEEQSGKRQEREKKQEPLPQSVAIALFPTILPARLPGSFGLPSAGDEAGATQIPADAAPVDTFEPAARIEIDAPGPRTKELTLDPDVELAFAVRLAGFTNSGEPQPLGDVTSRPQRTFFLAEPAMRPIAPTPQRELAGPNASFARAIPVVEGMPEPQAITRQSNEPATAIEPVRPIEPQRPAAQAIPVTTTAPSPDVSAKAPTETVATMAPREIGSEIQRPAVQATPVVTAMPEPEVGPAKPNETTAAVVTIRTTSESQPLAESAAPVVALPPQQKASSIESGEPAEPIRISSEAQRPAAQTMPAAAAAPQQGTLTSDSLLSDSNTPEQKSVESAPRPQRQRMEHLEPDATAAHPAGNASPIAAAENIVSRDTSSLPPGPAPIVIASSAIAPQLAATPSTPAVKATDPVHHAELTSVSRPSSTSEVTEISMTVPVSRSDSAREERVAIHMVQRGTEVHVAVRAPDPEVAQSLRQDLTQLASSLDEAGFRAETWRPAAIVAAVSSANRQRDMGQDPGNRYTPDGEGRPEGNDGRESGEQRRRQQNDRPRWVAELEQQRDR